MSEYEIEETVDGRKVRRPANAAEHRVAADLCHRALLDAEAERERLLTAADRVGWQIKILRQAISVHDVREV